MRSFATTKAAKDAGWPASSIAISDYIKDQAASTHGAVLANIDRSAEQRDRVSETKRRRRHYLDGIGYGHRPDPDKLAELDKAIQDEEAELARLAEQGKKLSEIWQGWKGLETRLDDFRSSVAGQTIKPVLVKPTKDATVESIRTEIATNDAEVARTAAAPLPAADLRRMANRHIDQIAAKGEPTIWHRTTESPIKLDQIGPETLIWLFSDEIKAKVAGLIGEDQPGSMSLQDRERRLQNFAARKLELERIEEALIEAAEAEGKIIARRPDASTEAILGVEIVRGR